MASERGFVGTGSLLVLGAVVVLVWAVPLVLVSGDRVPSPRSGDAREPVGATAAPRDVPAAGSDVRTDPIGVAAEVAAEGTLNRAIRVAQVYHAENGTFQGFGPEVAVSYDPTIVYTPGSPIQDMVSMAVTPTTVVLVILNGDEGYLCAAATGDVVSFGRTYATTPGQCRGGW